MPKTVLGTALLAFADVLAIAEKSGENGLIYDVQHALVAECRATGRRFVASMPVRHRFTCPVCGLQRGEVLLHVEDPARSWPSSMAPAPAHGLWGAAAGTCFDVALSGLHAMLAPDEPAPDGFYSPMSRR